MNVWCGSLYFAALFYSLIKYGPSWYERKTLMLMINNARVEPSWQDISVVWRLAVSCEKL